MRHYYALFSGGVDSTMAILKVIVQESNARITPVFIDYGQKSAEKEWCAVKKLTPLLKKNCKENVFFDDCREIRIPNLFEWSNSTILRGRQDFGETDLENRNMVLISIVVSIILSDRKKDRTLIKRQQLIVGFKNEHYDTTKKFASCMNQIIGQEIFGVKITTPLIENDNVLRWHSLSKKLTAIKGAESLLKDTWSCYYPTSDGKPCEKCPSCKSRFDLTREVATRIRMKS